MFTKTERANSARQKLFTLQVMPAIVESFRADNKVKAKASKNGKPLRKAELLKQGYSERFISEVEAA
jgi:hypothetical protein